MTARKFKLCVCERGPGVEMSAGSPRCARCKRAEEANASGKIAGAGGDVHYYAVGNGRKRNK